MLLMLIRIVLWKNDLKSVGSRNRQTFFCFTLAYVKGIRISLRRKTEVMNVKRMWFAVMSSFFVPTFGEVIFILFSFIPDVCQNMNLESLPSVFFTLALSCPPTAARFLYKDKTKPTQNRGHFWST